MQPPADVRALMVTKLEISIFLTQTVQRQVQRTSCFERFREQSMNLVFDVKSNFGVF